MTAINPITIPSRKRKLLRTTTRSSVTFEDMRLIADRCFAELGAKTVLLWKRYNANYFGGELKPTPVLYVPTSPYGHWVGCTVFDRNIYLMYPGEKRSWGFVRGVLLHEMLHQYLRQVGKATAHQGEPWREEIMRISRLFGLEVWAGKYTVAKIDGRSVRINKPNPDASSKAQALNQDQISKWPYSIGVEPPDLARDS
jgi:hypothetical protein